MKNSSLARAGPTRRGKRHVPPQPGITPNTASGWPLESFYSDKRAEISQTLYKLPSSDMGVYGKYQSYACTALLSKAISGLSRELRDLDEQMVDLTGSRRSMAEEFLDLWFVEGG